MTVCVLYSFQFHSFIAVNFTSTYFTQNTNIVEDKWIRCENCIVKKTTYLRSSVTKTDLKVLRQ